MSCGGLGARGVMAVMAVREVKEIGYGGGLELGKARDG